MALDFDDNEPDLDVPSDSESGLAPELALFADSQYRASPGVLDAIPLDHLTPQRTELRDLLEEFANVFAEDPNALGRTDLTLHHIRLKDETPVKQLPRVFDPVRTQFARDEIQ